MATLVESGNVESPLEEKFSQLMVPPTVLSKPVDNDNVSYRFTMLSSPHVQPGAARKLQGLYTLAH